VWITGLVFFDDRPRDMEQLPSGGTPSNFLWLPGRTQPAIEGLDDGVMLGVENETCKIPDGFHNML
jgi:hypothetical protein